MLPAQDGTWITSLTMDAASARGLLGYYPHDGYCQRKIALGLQMNFNADKCSVMHVEHNNMEGNYTISNQQLPTTYQQQDLGIIISKDLKLKKQREKSSKTANRILEFIARNFRYINKELILPLYKSLVRPHLEHAERNSGLYI